MIANNYQQNHSQSQQPLESKQSLPRLLNSNKVHNDNQQNVLKNMNSLKKDLIEEEALDKSIRKSMEDSSNHKQTSSDNKNNKDEIAENKEKYIENTEQKEDEQKANDNENNFLSTDPIEKRQKQANDIRWKNFNFSYNLSFFSKLFFIDFLKLLMQCSRSIKSNGILQLEHIPFLKPEEKVENTYNRFEEIMEKKIHQRESQGKKLSPLDMLSVILQTFYVSVLSTVISVLCFYALKIFFSNCISFLITSVIEGKSNSVIYGWAVVMAVTQYLYISLVHHSVRFFTSFFIHFRAIFNKALFKKVSSLSSFCIKEANIGKLVNLVSNDLNLLEMKSYSIINLLSLPPPIIAVAIILYFRFDAYALIGLGVMIAYIPVQILFAKVSAKFFKEKASLIDQRVKFTNEIIEGIRLIKMYAWEEAFVHLFTTIRKTELRKILVIQFIYLVEHSFSYVSGLFASFIVFFVVYRYGDHSTLTVANMFSTLDLLQYVKQQVVASAGFGIVGLLELKVILERMITVVTIKSSEMINIEVNINYDGKQINFGEIEMKSFSGFWNENQPPVLSDINLEVKKGECIGIVGRVGCGKTSFLSCLLKEIPKYKGYFNFKGKIAYVEQEPYIFSKTIRENIVFGSKFDETFYNQVLEACCLIEDLKLLDCGDLTQIGERGINISGGQKARIALARAIYSKADIYLLDDPLSAVDSKVAKLLNDNAIQGILKGKTVFLATHQIPFTKETDRIIIINDGKFQHIGTFEELQESLSELGHQINHEESLTQSKVQNKTEQDNEEQDDESIDDNDEKDNFQKEKGSTPKKSLAAVKKEAPQKKDNLYTKEEDEKIVVNLKTYFNYFRNSKIWFLVPLMFILFITCEVVFIFYSKTIGLYGSANEDNFEVISLLGYLAMIYFINLIIKYSLLTLVANTCSFSIHNKMINSLVRSVVLFFDRTPSGRILNRFSSDLGIIDQDLTRTAMDTIEIICSFCVLLGTIISINPYFAIIGGVEIVILGLFLGIAKKVLVQSKQIDLRYKSPVYTFFNQTTQGVLPIRIYEKQELFAENFDYLLNNSLRASYTYWYNSRAFGFYVNMVTTLSAIVGIFMVLSINMNPTMLGQTITYFLSISDGIQWGLRQMIQTDVCMSSAQRAMNLSKIDQEPSLRTSYDKKVLLKAGRESKKGKEEYSFPVNGEVEFQNVKMKYRQDLDYVLNGLSFKLKAGEKVGCIGRTGAGKSSIIQALFRMTEIESNEGEQREEADEENGHSLEMAIFIDNHNIKDVGLHTLRGGISIIPQIPFIFSGTIRRNLDPLSEFSDEHILDILEDISLKEKVNSLSKGLYTDMTNVSEIFSTGQKQLICLGRAILRKSKLIVLDEATANCDMFTDEFIQKKIREKFVDSTVITVAHRLNTIADYDRIIVMDKGVVIETGSPHELLNLKSGVFSSMVSHTGKKNSQLIHKIAKQAYLAKNSN